METRRHLFSVSSYWLSDSLTSWISLNHFACIKENFINYLCVHIAFHVNELAFQFKIIYFSVLKRMEATIIINMMWFFIVIKLWSPWVVWDIARNYFRIILMIFFIREIIPWILLQKSLAKMNVLITHISSNWQQ